jgi:hypothetical protein
MGIAKETKIVAKCIPTIQNCLFLAIKQSKLRFHKRTGFYCNNSVSKKTVSYNGARNIIF